MEWSMVPCEQCGTPFPCYPNRKTKRRYCSRDCANKGKIGRPRIGSRWAKTLARINAEPNPDIYYLIETSRLVDRIETLKRINATLQQEVLGLKGFARPLLISVIPLLVLACLVIPPAAAATVGPLTCQMSWVQSVPSGNNAATGWYIYLSQTSEEYADPFRHVPVTRAGHIAAQTITLDCRDFALTDGQWYATVKASNSAGLSDASNEAAFTWDTNQATPALDPPTVPYIRP